MGPFRLVAAKPRHWSAGDGSLTWRHLGKGIINSDGEVWKVQRKAGLAFLNTKNLQVLTDIALPQYLSQSVEYLKTTAEGCREVDLQAVFHEITTQLMGKMAYNVCFHSYLVSFPLTSQTGLYLLTNRADGNAWR